MLKLLSKKKGILMFGINEILSGKIKISKLTLTQKLDILNTNTPQKYYYI